MEKASKAKSKVEKSVNPMRKVDLNKVTVNICVGNDKNGMVKAEKLLIKLTNKTPVKNTAKKRLATWQLRPGLPIGYKVTLRDEEGKKFIQWILDSKGKKLSRSSIDKNSNFSVGFHEYLDLIGMKYDADIGIMGFEVMATFTRPGFRIKSRNLRPAKVPKRHRVTPEEVAHYMKENFKVEMN